VTQKKFLWELTTGNQYGQQVCVLSSLYCFFSWDRQSKGKLLFVGDFWGLVDILLYEDVFTGVLSVVTLDRMGQ
jgi:hypothetical protein